MAGKCKSGVYQMENGLWAYRFSLIINGKRVSRKKTTDSSGNKLKNQKAAAKAREEAIAAAYNSADNKPTVIRKTFKEVFEEYSKSGRTGKAYATIKKQDSLWNNHLCERFGKRYIDEISVAEIEDYLAELYYIEGFSFMYTESFLKMFYLILGQAYSRNYLEVDIYNKLCVNKNTKIHMPKIKTDDDTEIKAFSRKELSELDGYFKGTNAETAYMLGRYCGLRINECFGLKWENVDFQKGIITIDRQMQYQEGLIKLVAPKTRNSKREIFIPEILKEYLNELYKNHKSDEKTYFALREQNQRFIEDLNGEKISSTELVNCLYDGKIQTLNSMKYHTREIRDKLKIDFKYHYLRHTYGTLMADMNTPAHLLCKQMGHANIQVTQRYYIALSQDGINALQSSINQL